MLKNDQWIFQCYNYQPPPGKHVLVFLWNCIILFVLILWFFGTISVNCVERKTYFDRPLVISGQQMKHPCCLWCLGDYLCCIKIKSGNSLKFEVQNLTSEKFSTRCALRKMPLSKIYSNSAILWQILQEH